MIESNTNNELERKIDLYVEGKLSAVEIDELWAELIQNDYYLDYLKTAASLKKLSEKRSKQTKFYSIIRSGKWMAAAAAILIIGSFSVLNLFQNGGYAVEPISSIELDYYRSTEGVINETENSDLIIRAISLANSGEIENAVSLIDSEIATLEDGERKMELLVTAGSIYYNANRFDEAIERFEGALDIETQNVILKEQNFWYLGNTYFQLNKITEARQALEKAYDLNGAYSRIAQSYIKALSD